MWWAYKRAFGQKHKVFQSQPVLVQKTIYNNTNDDDDDTQI
jgi:hypothetical protein